MAPAAVEGLEGWSDPFGVGWCSGGAAALPDRAGSGCWRRWAVLSGGEAPVGEQGSMWTLVGLAGTLEQGGGLASWAPLPLWSTFEANVINPMVHFDILDILEVTVDEYEGKRTI
ncbi:hypothetical protein QQ045_014998 [Rhodiola kirilowii]